MNKKEWDLVEGLSGLLITGFGLYQFDTKHNYLTGLLYTLLGITLLIKLWCENRQNNESL